MLTMTFLGFIGSIEKHAGTIKLRAAAVIAIFDALLTDIADQAK
jgi:hypothetical protein